jgi:RsiW-degrading membrane proteinase PrsW (M82 family)
MLKLGNMNTISDRSRKFQYVNWIARSYKFIILNNFFGSDVPDPSQKNVVVATFHVIGGVVVGGLVIVRGWMVGGGVGNSVVIGSGLKTIERYICGNNPAKVM